MPGKSVIVPRVESCGENIQASGNNQHFWNYFPFLEIFKFDIEIYSLIVDCIGQGYQLVCTGYFEVLLESIRGVNQV